MEDRIAKITRTLLGTEDHGVFTAMLTVDYGGNTQGVGGYALDEPRRDDDGKFIGRGGTAYGMEFIKRIIDACGVGSWEDVKGRTVIVMCEDGWNGQPLGIKPLPTERGKPFLFSDLQGYAEVPVSR